MDQVIRTRGLSRRFGAITAVADLSVTVRRGEVFGLLGHNGAGKTTTIRLLNGVLTPSAGGATVLGLDPRTDGPRIRRDVGVLAESPGLDPRMTAREVLIFFAELYGVDTGERDARIAALLEQFDLAERAGERVGGYSTGMKQRLALARALLHRPALLFLDEPTTGLDPVAAHDLRALVRRLARQESVTVVLCTHNLDEAEALCDRVAILQSGSLLRIGSVPELRAQVTGARRVRIAVRPDQVQPAVDALAGRGVPVDGGGPDGLGVEVGDREEVPAVVAALAAAGIGIYEVTMPQVSLEDVYFRLHGLGGTS